MGKKSPKGYSDINYNTGAPSRATTPDGIPVFCSHDEIILLEKAVPNPRNPNQHSPEQIDRLAKVIKAAGWRAPVTISKRSGFIVKGHGRRLAAIQNGWEYVPADFQDYANEAEEWADLIADNRLAELSTIDEELLSDIIGDMDGDEVPVELTGYSEEELREILAALEEEEGSDDDGVDAVPPLEETPVSRTGDLWLLGQHKLLIGDATKREDIDQLMAGELAQMVNTDPPYGVSYETQSGKFDMIENDDLRHDDLMGNLLIPAFRNYVEFSDPGAAFYIWHASSTRRDFDDAMTATGIIEKQQIIWVKTCPVLGRADYQWAHEVCFYAEKAGESAAFYGDRSQRTVWKVTLREADNRATVLTGGVVLTDGAGGKVYLNDKPPKNRKLRYIRLKSGRSVSLHPAGNDSTVWEISRDAKAEHPTQKPVELAIKAIDNSSQPGDLIADFFGGSGYTLVGAEMTGRRANIIELNPVYGDVIINRYMRLTGNEDVTCIRDGQEYSYSALKDADNDSA